MLDQVVSGGGRFGLAGVFRWGWPLVIAGLIVRDSLPEQATTFTRPAPPLGHAGSPADPCR